jgi:thymidylate synthase ThyX/intein/homing endonuclease
MQLVEPQVFLIASTQLHEEGVVDWLSIMNGQAVLNHIAGEDEEKLIELCGRRCYLSFDVGLNPNVTKIRTNSQEYHKNLLASGHGSVLEHSSATFAFENISRVFCYSEDMDVLTKDGWKSWKDITGHETFATLKEGELVYEKAEEYFKKQYTGKMYSVQSQQIDLLVTPDHRMWVQDIQTRKYRRNEQKFEIKLAKDILNKKNRYQKCANWKGNSQTKFCIDPVIKKTVRSDTGNEITREYNGCSINTELFAKFLGFFISEGHLSNSDTSICIAQNEGETHDEIFNVITDMGFHVSSCKQGKANCKTIKFKCFALYEWLKKCGQGSLNKRIPREVLEWDKNLLLILYDAMLKGDGNKHKKNGHEVIYTGSVQLANDIQELLLKAGKSANIRVDERIGKSHAIKTGQVIKNKNIGYVVSLVSNLYPHVNLHLDSKESNRWKKNNGFMDEFIDYEGNVYCVKVPSGLLYVRRNGKACWSGNTHEVVRHRAGVAMCLSGDTMIYSENKCNGVRQGCKKRTIKSLYERTLHHHGRSRLKLLTLRALDQNNNTFTTNRIKNVFKSGIKPCFEIILEDGKKITCSKDHRFLTKNGWSTINDIAGGLSLTGNGTAFYNNKNDMFIAVNGCKQYENKEWFQENYYSFSSKELAVLCGLSRRQVHYWVKKHGISNKRNLFCEDLAISHEYKKSEWLFERYHTEKKSIKEIADECGTTQSVIRNWLRKFGLQSRRMPSSYIPWNKNKKYKHKQGMSELRRKHLSEIRKGENNPAWKGGVTPLGIIVRQEDKEIRTKAYIRDGYSCRNCGSKKKLHLHHIVPLWTNPQNPRSLHKYENLITLCSSCHGSIASNELKFAPKFQELIKSNIVPIPSGVKKTRGKFIYGPKYVKIKSITYVGEIETYDIEMEAPHHNFIANGIITHNSQESLRYVRLNKLKFWIPPEIDANKDAREVFIDLIEKSEEAQAKLAKIFDIENLKSFSQKKVLTSAFRRIAPDGLATGIVLTFNMRALRHVLAMRTSVHAEVEIRKVFNKVFDIAIQEWPFIFQDFKKIDTGDGLFECVPEFAKV